MKPLLPLELVLGTGLFFATALSLPAQSASPSPSIVPPTFESSVSGPAPNGAPEPVRNPPSWVPPPNPAPVIPAVQAPSSVILSSVPPDLNRIARARPQIEVWLQGRDRPQRLRSHRPGRLRAFISGNVPFTVVLQFHPSLAGKVVAVFPGDGITLHLRTEVVQIAANGECLLVMEQQATQVRSQLEFEIDGVSTVLRLVRAPVAATNEPPGLADEEGK